MISSRRCIVEQTQQQGSAGRECPDCHAYVADLDAHARWHSRLVQDLAVAVDKDATRRVTAH
jgi:hypothetical protein